MTWIAAGESHDGVHGRGGAQAVAQRLDLRLGERLERQLLGQHVAAERAREVEEAPLLVVRPSLAVPDEPPIPGRDVAQLLGVAPAEAQRELVIGDAGR